MLIGDMTEDDTFLALKKWSFNDLMCKWDDNRIDLSEFRRILLAAGWTWEEFVFYHSNNRGQSLLKMIHS